MPGKTPFYRDWTFWAVALSLVATVLSQLPPIRLLIKPSSLDVNVYSRIGLNHLAGNPSASIVISIRNNGGRELRVNSMQMTVSRDGKQLLTLPSEGYFETATSTTPVLFIPFDIKPEENWTHSVSFVNELDRASEKQFRENTAALNANIQEKLKQRHPGDMQPVTADNRFVEPFLKIEDALFVWKPGEYTIDLKVNVEPGSASFNKKYRFTLFESDTATLLDYRKNYKFGAGLIYSIDSNKGINVPITLE